LRLALPAAMGRLWLSSTVSEFALAYPEVSLEVEYSERFVDIVAEGFNAAIRIGELSDNRLVAKKLCDHRRILCAAPTYLQRRGERQNLRKARHGCCPNRRVWLPSCNMGELLSTLHCWTSQWQSG